MQLSESKTFPGSAMPALIVFTCLYRWQFLVAFKCDTVVRPVLLVTDALVVDPNKVEDRKKLFCALTHFLRLAELDHALDELSK
jgi:hypothetical protein